MSEQFDSDLALRDITKVLTRKYKCHTVILYGSRARGTATKFSDYDVVGICSRGLKMRIAKKTNGVYWDVFVYSEKDLRTLSEQQLGWRDAKVVFERGNYGRNFIHRLQKFVKEPFKPAPSYEIEATKVWSEKQLERISVGDVHGLYRRVELQQAAVADYFHIRRKRFSGPKEALEWLRINDPGTFKLFSRVYKNPMDMKALKTLVDRVYKT
ncbi:MAG: hypothetical protein A4S09_11670 [Proteobacteria bacterium SG_bin7]|nr:MAG: hypothetical protein A4S09_11670 [Proteobacteria bacterium SG_bin7]